MATGVIGGFTNSVGNDVMTFPDFYRETRDGPQILFLKVLAEFGWLKEPPRDHSHLDPPLTERRTRYGIQCNCATCGAFYGYKRSP